MHALAATLQRRVVVEEEVNSDVQWSYQADNLNSRAPVPELTIVH